MFTRLLGSRTVRGSCNGLLLHTKNEVPNDSRCRFPNVQKQLPTPFIVHADFESLLKSVNKDVDVTQGVDTDTQVFQEHIPCCFAYKIVSSVDPDFSRPLVMYRGEDAADMFYVSCN